MKVQRVNSVPVKRTSTKKTDVFFLLILISSTFLASCFSSSEKAPWLGRGKNLQCLPYKIVVGPVEVNRGVVGILEIGMKREDIVAKLGHPIVRAMTAEEVSQKSVWDVEDVSDELYEGVFAWVQYDKDRKINSICFDLAAFHEKFGGEQQVILHYQGRTVLFGRHLSQSEVIVLLQSHLGLTRLRIEAARIVVIGTGIVLEFDTGKHLSKIWLTSWRAKQ